MPKTREEIDAQLRGIESTIEAERTAISEDGAATGERQPPPHDADADDVAPVGRDAPADDGRR